MQLLFPRWICSHSNSLHEIRSLWTLSKWKPLSLDDISLWISQYSIWLLNRHTALCCKSLLRCCFGLETRWNHLRLKDLKIVMISGYSSRPNVRDIFLNISLTFLKECHPASALIDASQKEKILVKKELAVHNSFYYCYLSCSRHRTTKFTNSEFRIPNIYN